MNVSWMTNPDYLAQVSHALGGYAVIVTATLLSILHRGGWDPIVATFGVGAVLAALKEFWFDLRYETPKQTLWDSVVDFFFYMLGGAAGLGVAAYAEHAR